MTSGFNRSFRVAERPLVITNASQLPNLEVWYDANDGTTNSARFNNGTITSGTEVSAWHNGGGLTSHDWNSVGGKRPEFFSPILNSKGIVRFNSFPSGTPTGEDADTDEFLSINPVAYLQSLAGCSMFFVMKTASTAAGTRILCSTDVGGFKWGQNGTSWIGGFSGSDFTVDSTTVDTNYYHVAIIFDGSKTGNASRLRVRMNSVDKTLTFTGTVSSATSASASYFFGGCTGTSTSNTSNFWIGDLAELLIFTRTVSSGELIAIEDYISNKWGV